MGHQEAIPEARGTSLFQMEIELESFEERNEKKCEVVEVNQCGLSTDLVCGATSA